MKLVTELKELKQLNKLTNSEIQVVDYLLDYPQEIAKLSSRQLATLTHTSAATVVRVCQKVGMSGYGEFKLKYLQEISQTPRHINRENPITSNESIHTILNKVAALKMTAIEETKKGIDLD
ncbi:MAG: MurR/RpiR family transcriptional regulator [Turicibacter sanguinis]